MCGLLVFLFFFGGEGCVRMGGGVWLLVGFFFERKVGERVSRREKNITFIGI